MRALRNTVLPALLLVLTGCGIQGNWVYDHSDPEGSMGHFKLARVKFMDDGTYTADSEYGDGEAKTSSGTYTFKDGMLKLMTEDGAEREYNAMLQKSGSELCVASGEGEHEVKVFMKRD